MNLSAVSLSISVVALMLTIPLYDGLSDYSKMKKPLGWFMNIISMFIVVNGLYMFYCLFSFVFVTNYVETCKYLKIYVQIAYVIWVMSFTCWVITLFL